MADDFIEDAALRFEGFNDAQIAQIKSAIPKFAQLTALAKKNQADLNQAWLLISELTPVMEMVANQLKGRMT